MNILSLSGGKDSVASYFLCRHEIDCIIYVDSGVDFPSIKKTALMIGSDFASRGGRFEVLSFDFFGGSCIVTGKSCPLYALYVTIVFSLSHLCFSWFSLEHSTIDI